MKILPDTLTLPPRTITGAGCISRLLQECTAFGSRGALIHGRSVAATGLLPRILAAAPAGLQMCTWQHPGEEPTLDQLADLLGVARAHEPDWVAAVGGGSTLDLGKACAGLLRAPLAPQAYHDGAALPEARVPFVAVPTTAGTGTEATIVSVLTNAGTGVKKSFRHPSHMARLVLLDPDLLDTCPPSVIAASGMDAFTQAFESFVSKGSTWFTDELCLKALSLIASSIESVFRGQRGNHSLALMQGSYLAGLALSNARLGLVHGLAHPLGARYHAAHGLVCAVCLPLVMEFNRPACEAKYAHVAALLGHDPVAYARHCNTALGIRSPFSGHPHPDIAGIVRETLASGSTAANPRPATAPDVERLLADLMQPS